MGLRFAIDTGGTFTDLVVTDEHGALGMFKASTTPGDPAAGVIDSLRIAAEHDGETLAAYLAKGEMLVHGTTHAINAIVTGNTARTAFLTTAGHPDTLVFREGGRMEPFNFTIPYPEPIVPKALTFEFPERIMSNGAVRTPVDEKAVLAIVEKLKAEKVQAVAICFLWSVVNPAHEIAVGKLLEKHLPGVPYTLSHRINPSLREYRRASSTCFDAALRPVMGAYMASLDGRLRAEGFKGRLLIVTSQGGVIDADHAANAPVQLINSGPSMAPVAARACGAKTDLEMLIVGDTGGTTFDVSLVRRGRIPRTRETWLGQPFRSPMTGLPSVDVRSIGAGGGSIAWVDSRGLLHVGPQSAGALPGPACYRRGGTKPTVTDASVVLGFIDPSFFLGGDMPLDHAAAEDAILREVAKPLACTVDEAAAAIMELATEHMVQAIMDITVNQGIDPTAAAFVAGGGAAGLNCVAIGRRLGCPLVIVPETGAALSAAGALLSDLTAYHQAVFPAHTAHFDQNAVNGVLDQLKAKCDAFAAGPGAGASSVAIDWSTEARYPEQVWEIEVPLHGARFTQQSDVDTLVEDFHRAHQEIYAVNDPGSAVEMIGWGAAVRCRIGSDQPGRLSGEGAAHDMPARQVLFADGSRHNARVYRFEALADGEVVVGPAIIESSFTSIVLDPGARSTRDTLGNLVIEVGTSS